MADNPFAKKMQKKADEKESGDGKAPTGKNSPPPGHGEKSGGNPFTKKMQGRQPMKGKKGRPKGKAKGRRGKLQPFQKR